MEMRIVLESQIEVLESQIEDLHHQSQTTQVEVRACLNLAETEHSAALADIQVCIITRLEAIP